MFSNIASYIFGAAAADEASTATVESSNAADTRTEGEEGWVLVPGSHGRQPTLGSLGEALPGALEVPTDTSEDASEDESMEEEEEEVLPVAQDDEDDYEDDGDVHDEAVAKFHHDRALLALQRRRGGAKNGAGAGVSRLSIGDAKHVAAPKKSHKKSEQQPAKLTKAEKSLKAMTKKKASKAASVRRTNQIDFKVEGPEPALLASVVVDNLAGSPEAKKFREAEHAEVLNDLAAIVYSNRMMAKPGPHSGIGIGIRARGIHDIAIRPAPPPTTTDEGPAAAAPAPSQARPEKGSARAADKGRKAGARRNKAVKNNGAGGNTCKREAAAFNNLSIKNSGFRNLKQC